MKPTASHSQKISKRGSPSTPSSLFEAELSDIYWAEKALTIAIPEMIGNATSEDVKKSLEIHLQNAKDQVEQILLMLGKEPEARTNDELECIVDEAKDLMRGGTWCYEKVAPSIPRYTKVNTKRVHRERYTRSFR